ncbi:GumC family protein [Croceicoccus naphthovorans]|uniref:GumC family protein n=1 Tax=Croceicoccus naphthovorans TaxID=1348774 RepID=UPI00069F35E6|nr:polysaccharide biosynthesis tyrosine autokinase [Croceicoccus naphthovorans]MBB3990388.1 capsular exopolysaccharide synthesis family protein [Croceicoccus naphthovorans]
MNRHSSIAAIGTYRPDFAPDPIENAPVLNMGRVGGIVWHYRLLIAGLFLGALLLGLAITMLLTPEYTASASLQIDQEAQRILDSQDEASSSAWQDADRFLQTHVDVLRSRRMAERVAGELDLFDDADAFFATMQVDPPKAGLGDPDLARREKVLRVIADNLDIHLPGDSRVVSIAFTSPDPQFAARFANTFADSYARYNVDRRVENTEYARDFLSRQLSEARDRLERAEQDANNYARTVGLVRTPSTAPGLPESTLTAVDLGAYNGALAEARTERIAAQSKWNRVAGAPDIAIGDAISNQAMQQLIAARAAVHAQLQAQLANKQAAHPAVAPLRNQLEEYDAQIASLAEGIRRSVRDDYLMAVQREQELQGRVNGLKTATQQERDESVQLNTLMREVDTSRQLYDALLQRYRETSAEANITSNNVQQIDRAMPPVRPSSPRLLLNLALAGLLGLAVAAVVVFLREQGDDRLRRPSDIAERLGLKLLGITPKLKGDADPVAVLAEPASPLAESFASLRTALQFATPVGLPRLLMLTSTEAAEGKSSTAYGIARSVADGGARVLLIDCDLRRPAIADITGVRNTVGLTGALATPGAVGSAIEQSEIANLFVMTSGARPAVPTDLIGSAQMMALLSRFGERFDTIVLDAPPVLGLADAPILANLPGVATLFVVEAGRTHRAAAKSALARLRDTNADVIGAVMSRFDFAEARRLGLGHEYGRGYTYYNYGA